MIARFCRWSISFKGALFFCIVGLLNVAMSLHSGSMTLWFDVAFVVFWVWIAKRALRTQADLDEFSMVLTQEQKDKIHEASTHLADVIAEVEAEYRQQELAHNLKQREKARVQSDKREDQEAGTKGDD
jgi:hypothetical protein